MFSTAEKESFPLSSPLRRDFAPFLRELFQDFPRLPAFGQEDFPLVNLHEEGGAYLVDAEMPGVAEKDIDIRVDGQQLEIRGTKRVEKRSDDGYHRREIRTGRFYRAIRFPSEVDAQRTEARLENGVLTVRLPMREGVETKKIPVQVSTA